MKENSLTLLRKMGRFYEDLLRHTAHQFDLSSIDIKVCSFLMNNPQLDSAKHIVELRMLPKSNVSSSIDKLIVRGYMVKRVDENDRRQYHLSLTDKAKPLCEQINAINAYFFNCLYEGIGQDLLETQEKINRIMIDNLDRARKDLDYGK